jgi:hypothetical protein
MVPGCAIVIMWWMVQMVSSCAIVMMVVDSADGVELCNCNDGGG